MTTHAIGRAIRQARERMVRRTEPAAARATEVR